MRKQKSTTCGPQTYQGIVDRIHPDIVNQMSRLGWNALAIYDIVRQELAKEKRGKRG